MVSSRNGRSEIESKLKENNTVLYVPFAVSFSPWIEARDLLYRNAALPGGLTPARLVPNVWSDDPVPPSRTHKSPSPLVPRPPSPGRSNVSPPSPSANIQSAINVPDRAGHSAMNPSPPTNRHPLSARYFRSSGCAGSASVPDRSLLVSHSTMS